MNNSDSDDIIIADQRKSSSAKNTPNKVYTPTVGTINSRPLTTPVNINRKPQAANAGEVLIPTFATSRYRASTKSQSLTDNLSSITSTTPAFISSKAVKKSKSTKEVKDSNNIGTSTSLPTIGNAEPEISLVQLQNVVAANIKRSEEMESEIPVHSPERSPKTVRSRPLSPRDTTPLTVEGKSIDISDIVPIALPEDEIITAPAPNVIIPSSPKNKPRQRSPKVRPVRQAINAVSQVINSIPTPPIQNTPVNNIPSVVNPPPIHQVHHTPVNTIPPVVNNVHPPVHHTPVNTIPPVVNPHQVHHTPVNTIPPVVNNVHPAVVNHTVHTPVNTMPAVVNHTVHQTPVNVIPAVVNNTVHQTPVNAIPAVVNHTVHQTPVNAIPAVVQEEAIYQQNVEQNINTEDDVKSNMDETSVNTTEVNNIPDYKSMSYEDQEMYRTEFRIKFGHLRTRLHEYMIPDFPDTMPLEVIHRNYDKYYQDVVKQQRITEELEQHKVYLVVLWLFIELVCNKLGLNISGYTEMQMKSMNRYDPLLRELGENNYKNSTVGASTVSSPWPVEIRLVFVALLNAVALVIIKMLSLGEFGSNIVDILINGYLGPSNKTTTQATTARAIPGGAPLPQSNSTGLDIAGLLGQFGPMLLGGRGGNNQPTQQPQPQNPATPRYRSAYEE